ncbi:OGFRL1 [Branchiostoma lanceolatum]|uniref:OGFRL1 protein n=1 Tax=Branchiostoma lanceolatum TaxID=7740 RepID=A0A8J9ZJK7_BRALA|nr:OGFRL1 [Branchiostoma lanceolatum]
MQHPDEHSATRMGQSWSRYYGPEVTEESDDECWEEDPRVKRLRANGRLPPARAGREGLARAIRDFGWELVVPQGGRSRPVRLRSSWSSKDTRDYRKGYPGKRSNPVVNENYNFYTNNIKSKPDGDFIDNIHKDWWGDYTRLEMHHGYIQWLFPIREEGMNWQAMELQEHEIKLIMENEEARARILKSYELMLDFYGMKLKDKTTGEIVRSDNWEERLSHLNKSYHNYLRITRILKCLGEFGYEHLKAPFIHFVLQEALVEKTLSNTIESCLDYWLHTIVRKEDRIGLLLLADQLWDVEPAKEAGKNVGTRGAGKGQAAKNAGKETAAKDIGKSRPAKAAKKDEAAKDVEKDKVAKETEEASKSSGDSSKKEEDMKTETDVGDSIREDGDGQVENDGNDVVMEAVGDAEDTVGTDHSVQKKEEEKQHQSAIPVIKGQEEMMEQEIENEKGSPEVTHRQTDIENTDVEKTDTGNTEQGKDEVTTKTDSKDIPEGSE